MERNGILTHPAKVAPLPTPPVQKFFNSPSPQTFYFRLRLEMSTCLNVCIFSHGYFQQAHFHISGAIITD